jgi:CDP-diacylglycerol--glycerol-3-phosphate 3-phosphatidyltransferase
MADRASAPIDPNWVTSLRLPLAPLAVWFLLGGTVTGIVIAAILSLILELTDLADGWLARRYAAESDFGKLYDPFSDAFCRYTLFLGLYAIHVADLWMVIAIFYRDASISFFRQVSASRNVVVGARRSGKIKAIVQGVGTQIVFFALVVIKVAPTAPIAWVPWWTMLIMTLVTIASFVDYFVGHLPILQDAWANRPVRRK